ncbi:MAG: hypothetical protein IKJ98_11080 [Bacteroidales bacterium]|nr:hypothetical protein [Bacteroidales bacterium]
MDNKLHIRALEIAEKIRKEIPGFYCGFRTRPLYKGGGIDNGCYFRGNNEGAFIALTKEGCGICVNAHNIQLHVSSDAKTTITNRIFKDLIKLWNITNILKYDYSEKAKTKDLTDVELVSYIKEFKKYIDDNKINDFLYSKSDFDKQVKVFVDKKLLIYNAKKDKYKGVLKKYEDSKSKTCFSKKHFSQIIFTCFEKFRNFTQFKFLDFVI